MDPDCAHMITKNCQLLFFYLPSLIFMLVTFPSLSHSDVQSFVIIVVLSRHEAPPVKSSWMINDQTTHPLMFQR